MFGLPTPNATPSPRGLVKAITLVQIVYVGWKTQVNPAILAAIVQVESNFNPWAVGDAGESTGLGQLHARGAGAGWAREQLFDPITNLTVTANYIGACLAAHNYDVAKAFDAYNQGIGGSQTTPRPATHPVIQLYTNALAYWQNKGVLNMIGDALGESD